MCLFYHALGFAWNTVQSPSNAFEQDEQDEQDAFEKDAFVMPLFLGLSHSCYAPGLGCHRCKVFHHQRSTRRTDVKKQLLQNPSESMDKHATCILYILYIYIYICIIMHIISYNYEYIGHASLSSLLVSQRITLCGFETFGYPFRVRGKAEDQHGNMKLFNLHYFRRMSKPVCLGLR